MTLEHVYTPRGACKKVLEHRDAELLIAGPAGTGKSRACLEKLHAMALLNPGMRGLMLRKTHVSLTASAVVTWERDVVPEAMRAGVVEFYGGSAREPAQYRYKNGSKIMLGGLDKASKTMSTEYDVIYVQEATELTEDDWESLNRAFRSGKVSFQQLLADCNPAQETHWLKGRCEGGKTAMLRSTHKDNPLLYDDDGNETERGAEYLDRLRQLTGVRYERLYKGEWSSAEGVVYDNWSTAVHLIDQFRNEDEETIDPPASWPRYLAVDFGYTNPFVCQWWARDPDGRLHMYREVYKTKTLVSDHATVIEANLSDVERKALKAIICDHDAEGRAQLAAALGIKTTPAKKAVRDGIQAVTERLQDAGDGRPRLFIMRDALIERDPELVRASLPTCTAEEVTGYVWDQRPDKPPKEEPVKEHDHGMDAMRYMVMHLDGGKRRADMSGVDLTSGLTR